MEATLSERDQARTLLLGLRGLVRRFSVAERADVSCCGVTVAQAAALEALLANGPLRLGALSRRLGITPSTLTRNVERLEASGLVKREADPADARSARVALTARGRDAARSLEKQEVAFAEQILGALPRERRDVVAGAFRDLLAAVRSATERCCPGAYEHLMEGLPREESVGEGISTGGGTGCGCGPEPCPSGPGETGDEP